MEKLSKHLNKSSPEYDSHRLNFSFLKAFDLGNLNFSFITRSLKDNLNNYKKFTDPLIAALKEMGVEAEFQGRNDIVVGGKKISGNAQAYYKNKMLHHGTILYDANLAFVASVLNVKQDKIESKGIKSTRARVTNIKPFLKTDIDINELKLNLLQSLLNSMDVSSFNYPLTENDLNRVKQIQNDKYLQWSWNYGESTKSQNFKEQRFPGGSLQLYFDIKNGLIKNLKIYGDYLDSGDTRKISIALESIPYQENLCRNKLMENYYEKIIMSISLEEFLNCLF